MSARAARAGLLDRPRIGPHLGYNFDADALTLGVQATLPLTARIELYPSFDYYISPGTLWAINMDMKFRPPTRRGALYVGSGFDYLHTNAAGGPETSISISSAAGRRAAVPWHPTPKAG